MSSRREQRRQRRHNEKLVDDAWTALEGGNAALARRLTERALKTGFVNARLWLEHGLILWRCGDLLEAERAFRRALQISPDYAEPAVQLGKLLAKSGEITGPATSDACANGGPSLPTALPEASSKAGESDPKLIPVDGESADEHRLTLEGDRRGEGRGFEPFRAAWEKIEQQALTRSCVHLPALLRPDQAAALRAEAPGIELPTMAQLGSVLREHLVPVSERWDALLTRDSRTPAETRAPLSVRAPPRSSTAFSVRLYHLSKDASVLVERPGPGHCFLPLQLLLILAGSNLSEDAVELKVIDDRPGRKVHGSFLKLRPFDAAIFPAYARLQIIAGVHGLQPVQSFLRGFCDSTALLVRFGSSPNDS